MPLALDQHPETTPLGHQGEILTILVLNVAKLVTLPETAPAIAKEELEQTLLTSMKNTIATKDSKT